MTDISNAWRSTFSPLEDWCLAFEHAGFAIKSKEDDPDILIRYYQMMTALADAKPAAYPAHEIVGWKSALALAAAEVIGYGRVVGVLREAM